MDGPMSFEELGLLEGHCDTCGKPLDYCTCTPGECPGCEHCETPNQQRERAT